MRMPGSRGSSRNNRWMSSLHGSSFDRPDTALIARRLVRSQGPADRVEPQPGAALQLTDRDAPNEMQPPQLIPLLHADHVSSWPRPHRSSEAQTAPDATSTSRPGSTFNRSAGSAFSRNQHSEVLAAGGLPVQ